MAPEGTGDGKLGTASMGVGVADEEVGLGVALERIDDRVVRVALEGVAAAGVTLKGFGNREVGVALQGVLSGLKDGVVDGLLIVVVVSAQQQHLAGIQLGKAEVLPHLLYHLRQGCCQHWRCLGSLQMHQGSLVFLKCLKPLGCWGPLQLRLKRLGPLQLWPGYLHLRLGSLRLCLGSLHLRLGSLGLCPGWLGWQL